MMKAKDRWRWTYEAADGKIKNMPMQGSIEIGVQGQFKDFESTVNTVKTDLLTRDVNTRKAICYWKCNKLCSRKSCR